MNCCYSANVADSLTLLSWLVFRPWRCVIWQSILACHTNLTFNSQEPSYYKRTHVWRHTLVGVRCPVCIYYYIISPYLQQACENPHTPTYTHVCGAPLTTEALLPPILDLYSSEGQARWDERVCVITHRQAALRQTHVVPTREVYAVNHVLRHQVVRQTVLEEGVTECTAHSETHFGNWLGQYITSICGWDDKLCYFEWMWRDVTVQCNAYHQDIIMSLTCNIIT